MAARERAPQAEDGRILLLTLGFVVLGLMLVAVVASAAAVHLDHKRLYNLADVLAASAADAMPPGRHLVAAAPGVGGGGLLLSDDAVARAVAAELAAYPFPEQLPEGLRVAEADSPDGRSARVTLVASSHPPLVGWFTRTAGHGFTISASSTARAVTGGP
ncbi:hypothetical protein ET495_00795 [Xylanimonas allomyrinae]|uniref:Uncharacterized protein n=1 Tax=Xylanimonas allomyrinae TaxID=2509459 RepID=A0A4P6EVW8_9MICO|nr:hypothetical protein ET495_00795 [Xylanimonas allomyrinae]